MKRLLLSLTLAIATVIAYGQQAVYGGVIYCINFDDDNLTACVYGHTDDMPNAITILDKVTIDEEQYKVTKISINAFQGCTNLESVDLSKAHNLIAIEDYAFAGCTNLEAIDLSNAQSLTAIGNAIFFGCESLTSLDLSSIISLTTIGDGAFYGCSHLKYIDLSHSDNLTEIGNRAFYNCPNLTFVHMPKTSNSLSIGEEAFIVDENGIFGLNGGNLNYFNFPEGTISIGDMAFAGNRKLKDIKLPESLEMIGYGAFYNCYDLEYQDFIIPKNVKSIGNNAFTVGYDFIGGASTFIFMPATPPQIEKSSFNSYTTIFVPDGNLSSYRRTWSNMPFIILPLNGTLSLDINLSQAGTLLSQIPRDKILEITSLKISGDINGTDIQVLNKCANLQNLDLKNARIVSGGNKYYEDFATQTDCLTKNIFFGLKWLKSIVIPDGMTSIEPFVFSNMGSLRHATLNQSLKSIGERAFYGCSLDTIRIPKSVESIDRLAFGDNYPTVVIFEGFPTCKYYSFFNINDSEFFNSTPYVPFSERSLHISNIEGWFNIQFIFEDGSPYAPYTNPLHTMRNLYVNGELIKDLLIPSNVNQLGHVLFSTRSPFNSVWVNSSNPPSIYEDTFCFSPEGVDIETVLYIPEGSETDYWLHPIWGKFKQIRTFKAAELHSYTISHASIEIRPNESFQLGIVKPGGQAKEVEWISSNNEVANVNKCGLVTAMCDYGECVVTAMVDGQRLSCNVSVASHGISRADNPKIDPISIEFVSITTNPDMMNVRLSPVGSSTVINWISDDTSVATIENGLITYYEAGEQVRFAAFTENEQSVISPEITVSGIEDVECDLARPNTSDIYNLQGICVKRNATIDNLKDLTPGIYIYQGQKFIVR